MRVLGFVLVSLSLGLAACAGSGDSNERAENAAILNELGTFPGAVEAERHAGPYLRPDEFGPPVGNGLRIRYALTDKTESFEVVHFYEKGSLLSWGNHGRQLIADCDPPRGDSDLCGVRHIRFWRGDAMIILVTNELIGGGRTFELIVADQECSKDSVEYCRH